jgi:hypothetical protein
MGTADDVADADGEHVLAFGDAQRKARDWFQALARRDAGEPETGPYSVSQALDDYESDLKTRRGDPGNVKRARAHVMPELLARPVATLTGPELRRWRDKLAKEMAPASVNRTVTCLKAALNLAAEKNERIARGPWENGLKAIPDAERPRNVIVSDATVRSVLAECYETSPAVLEHLRDPQAREKAAREAERWATGMGAVTIPKNLVAVEAATPRAGLASSSPARSRTARPTSTRTRGGPPRSGSVRAIGSRRFGRTRLGWRAGRCEWRIGAAATAAPAAERLHRAYRLHKAVIALPDILTFREIGVRRVAIGENGKRAKEGFACLGEEIEAFSFAAGFGFLRLSPPSECQLVSLRRRILHALDGRLQVLDVIPTQRMRLGGEREQHGGTEE